MLYADFMPSTVFSRGIASSVGLCDHTVVWLRGEHDISTSPYVAQSFNLAIDLDDADLVVDLREATFIDVVIIGVIVGAKVKLARQGHVLLLRSPTPAIWRLLVLCGLSSLVIDTSAEPGAGTNSAGPLHSGTQECPGGGCSTQRIKRPDTHKRSIMSRSTMTAKQVSFL